MATYAHVGASRRTPQTHAVCIKHARPAECQAGPASWASPRAPGPFRLPRLKPHAPRCPCEKPTRDSRCARSALRGTLRPPHGRPGARAARREPVLHGSREASVRLRGAEREMWGDGHGGARLMLGVGGPPRCERPLVLANSSLRLHVAGGPPGGLRLTGRGPGALPVVSSPPAGLPDTQPAFPERARGGTTVRGRARSPPGVGARACVWRDAVGACTRVRRRSA